MKTSIISLIIFSLLACAHCTSAQQPCTPPGLTPALKELSAKLPYIEAKTKIINLMLDGLESMLTDPRELTPKRMKVFKTFQNGITASLKAVEEAETKRDVRAVEKTLRNAEKLLVELSKTFAIKSISPRLK